MTHLGNGVLLEQYLGGVLVALLLPLGVLLKAHLAVQLSGSDHPLVLRDLLLLHLASDLGRLLSIPLIHGADSPEDAHHLLAFLLGLGELLHLAPLPDLRLDELGRYIGVADPPPQHRVLLRGEVLDYVVVIHPLGGDALLDGLTRSDAVGLRLPVHPLPLSNLHLAQGQELLLAGLLDLAALDLLDSGDGVEAGLESNSSTLSPTPCDRVGSGLEDSHYLL